MKPANNQITLTALAVCLAACGGGQSNADANPRAGGAMSDSVELPLNGQRSGQINNDDGFWYWVNVTQAGQLDFQTLGNLDTYCGMYDAAGGSLAVDYNSGNSGNCRIQKQVNPGRYFYWVLASTQADRGSFTGNLNFLVEGGQSGGGGSSGGGTTPPPSNGGSNNGGMASRYVDNRDGTVTDVTTGLRWMRCSVGQTWDGRGCAGDPVRLKWYDMQRLAKSHSYAGERGWRLPSRLELSSIMYCSSGLPTYWSPMPSGCRGNYSRPTVDQIAFPGIVMITYWSGEDYDIDSSKAYTPDFMNGDAGTHYGWSKDNAERRAILVK